MTDGGNCGCAPSVVFPGYRSLWGRGLVALVALSALTKPAPVKLFTRSAGATLKVPVFVVPFEKVTTTCPP